MGTIKNPQQRKLREMSPEEQLEWAMENSGYLSVMGMHCLQVDGHLVSLWSYGDIDKMMSELREYVSGEDCPRREGAMG